MISVKSLTKKYGKKLAVNDIQFTVEPGRITGFLGPNGAGKSTTMRMIVGLDRPTAGSAEVNGRAYRDLPAPLHEAGVLLDARAAHPRRTAYKHLLAVAATHGISKERVHEVMGLAGIESVAGTRVGGFSLGMRQRLGIALALLGDPSTIILDEPVNGLDPDGIIWIRLLLRRLAAEGRTVLLSSHLMTEMAQTADHLIVIGQGRILANGPMQEVVATKARSTVRTRTHEPDRLIAALAGPEVTVAVDPFGGIEIAGLSTEQVAQRAAAAGVILVELSSVAGSLEEAYLALTADESEYRSVASASTPNGATR